MKLIRKAFKVWLAAQDPADPVGSTCDAADCPLALYLKSTGVLVPEVQSDSISYEEHTVPHVSFFKQYRDEALPRWAQRFVAQLDKLAEDSIPVTAADALAVLNTREKATHATHT